MIFLGIWTCLDLIIYSAEKRKKITPPGGQASGWTYKRRVKIQGLSLKNGGDICTLVRKVSPFRGVGVGFEGPHLRVSGSWNRVSTNFSYYSWSEWASVMVLPWMTLERPVITWVQVLGSYCFGRRTTYLRWETMGGSRVRHEPCSVLHRAERNKAAIIVYLYVTNISE